MSDSTEDIVLHDATLEEMIFWERIYVSIVNTNDCKSSSTARTWATRAVLNRRAVFPRLTADEKEGT